MSVELVNPVFTKIVLDRSKQSLSAEQNLLEVKNLAWVNPVEILARELKKAEGGINEEKKMRILKKLTQIVDLFPQSEILATNQGQQ